MGMRVPSQACDCQDREWKIKMLSGKSDEEGNKKEKKKTKKTPGKQKGREKERKTTSFYICCISLTKVRAGQRPRSPVGKRRSYSFEKPKLHPPKPVTISLELCNYFLLISTEHLKPTT